MKESLIEVTGEVTKKVKGAKFEVLLENGFTVLCTISGKIRMNSIKISAGDEVIVEISPYDLKNGRIIRRN